MQKEHAQDERALDFERFRARFPGVRGGPYLNVADRGLISVEVRAVLNRYLDECASGGNGETPRRWADLARQRFAALVRAGEHEIAIVKNVSDGINAFAAALDWKPGDNVVLCEEVEHPSNLFVWHNLRERFGVVVRNVAHERYRIDPERMIAAIDERTRLVSASMVTFAPGFRTDVAAIGEACRARDVLLLVDAAQAAGVVDIDLGRLPVDALAAGTPKALLGLYGLGFLFVREALAERLRPAYLSGAGLDRSSLDGSRDALALKRGAGRFEVGNHNYVGCVAAAASIEQLQTFGTERIERHACGLARDLANGLKERGLAVMDAGTDAARSNIVAVGSSLEAGIETTSDRSLLSLSTFLTERRVRLSIRRGILRFSTHGYTSVDDIAQTLALVSEWGRLA